MNKEGSEPVSSPPTPNVQPATATATATQVADPENNSSNPKERIEPVSSPPTPNVQPATATATATHVADPENNSSNPKERTEPVSSPPTPNVQPATATATTTQAADLENNFSNSAVASVQRQWKGKTLLEKCMLVLRLLCLLFSFISFIIMASNKHGHGQNFDDYQEYQYCLAIAILAFLYTMGQVVYQVYLLSTAKFQIPRQSMGILDFAGDQVTAYLLISASSAAIPQTQRMAFLAFFTFDPFTDYAAASISMAFLAFLAISLSALISGYRLSTQTYI